MDVVSATEHGALSASGRLQQVTENIYSTRPKKSEKITARVKKFCSTCENILQHVCENILQHVCEKVQQRMCEKILQHVCEKISIVHVKNN